MIDFTKDTHIHTNYSPDADKEATFKKYIEKAIQDGLTELTFTEHVDFDAVHPIFHDMINYDDYIVAFNNAKQESKLPIKLGVEIGYQSHVKNEIKNFLSKYDFEHIILSIHYIEKKDLYTKEYFQGKTIKEAFAIYFETLLEAVTEMDDFNVVGHFDYITRYSSVQDYDYEVYKDIIDKILKVLINKGKGIEINTSGFNTDSRMYPKIEIIERYLELGGINITIGSDAHRIEELGRKFEYVKKKISQILPY